MWLQLLELKILCLGKLIGKLCSVKLQQVKMKKIKFIQIFSDGSLNYDIMNCLITTKNYNFCEKDFKNSKFCDRKETSLKDVADYENFRFRHKF